jgi:ribosomal protein S18 acetylase RimI-like enzyme
MKEQEGRVRSAVPADAAGIARVHVDSWRETYTGLVPERFFSETAFERRREWWAKCLLRDRSIEPIFVALREDTIVGFASSGPAVGPEVEKGNPPVRDIHLYTIYLMAAEHGSGLGRALLDGVIGDEPAQLWVAAQNARAIAFYERNGFVADGVRVLDPSIDGLVEIRMIR